MNAYAELVLEPPKKQEDVTDFGSACLGAVFNALGEERPSACVFQKVGVSNQSYNTLRWDVGNLSPVRWTFRTDESIRLLPARLVVQQHPEGKE